MVGYIAISLKNGVKPVRHLPPTPERYWDMFRRSKIALPPQTFGLRVAKRGVRLPSPEVRVAQAAMR